ncbi:MAG: hypothetical protein LBL24_04985 [Bacteroidales bacterium]|nr:hypothetical protein [Bacteroidales bacterium]
MYFYRKGAYGYDLQFLKEKDSSLIVLKGGNGAEVIVSPKYQAKVFTSTANGPDGNSLGFVNHDVLNSNVIDEHMNGYGGENRFWLGPEGGQYSIYFEKGQEQAYDNWHTPKPIDIEPWDVVSSNEKQAVLKKEMTVTNYRGYQLKLNVDRKIELIDNSQITGILGIGLSDKINAVAYVTDHQITNLNDFEWNTETGTICIWILDMFIPAPRAFTFIPFNEGDEAGLGKIATTDYFGEIPADRLKIKDGMLYLKTDGKYRSKMGMNGKRVKAIAGNYDPDSGRLTVTVFDVDKNATYLNQEWNPAKDPLLGDAMNAYNDGPLEDGSIMGPFLEVESVSPAAFLKSAESLSHRHTVFHFVGEENDLNPIAEKLFGISLTKAVF